MILSRPLIFAVFWALLLGAGQVRAEEEMIALAPLDNRAKLSDDEIALLTDAVHSVLLEHEKNSRMLPEVKPCEDYRECLVKTAVELGATHLVFGSVVIFGGKYAATLEVVDLESGLARGKVSTDSHSDLGDLLVDLKGGVEKLVGVEPVPSEPPPPPEEEEPPVAEVPKPVVEPTGTLRVTSDPTGAKVHLWLPSQGELLIGQTPVTKTLEPGTYRLDVELEGYSHPGDGTVLVTAGETTDTHFEMEYVNYLLGFGISLMVGGAGVGAMSAYVGYTNSSGRVNLMGVGFLVGGVVLAGTGLALTIAGVKKKKRAEGALAKTPVVFVFEGGVAAGYSGTF